MSYCQGELTWRVINPQVENIMAFEGKKNVSGAQDCLSLAYVS